MTLSDIRTAGVLMLAVATLLAAACGGKEDKPLTPAQKDAIARAAGQPSSVQSPSALFERLAGTAAPGQGSRAAEMVRRATVPVVESPYAQKRQDRESPLLRDFPAPARGAAPEPEGPPYPARVRFEDLDWLAALPAPSEEVPGVRLGWYLNSSIAALAAAIDQNKPLVIVIGETSCAECEKLAKVLRCAAVERLAGEAVFAYGIPSRDKSTFAIAGSFGMESYPTVTVLEPESRILIERVRISGFFDATTLGKHLEEALWRVPPRSYVEFEPTALSAPARHHAPRVQPPRRRRRPERNSGASFTARLRRSADSHAFVLVRTTLRKRSTPPTGNVRPRPSSTVSAPVRLKQP